MIYSRYVYGAEFAKGRRVLELGCGSAPGFGLLGRNAAFLVGADIEQSLLREARAQWGTRFPFVRITAEHLPFATGSFDLVLFFEASYYVPDMEPAFDEIGRVLAPGGAVVFVNANPERPDFISSPYSAHYHTADEFRSALEQREFDVRAEGAFPVSPPRRVGRMLSLARRLLEATKLTPRTLKGRAILKRLVHGRLIPLPAEIQEGFGSLVSRAPLPRGAIPGFKVQYITGLKTDRGRQ